jgi:hypothetical protein
MKFQRVLRIFDSVAFWGIVFIIAVLFVFAYAFTNNRNSTQRNTEINIRQQKQLAYMCETIHVVDALLVQQIRVEKQALTERTLSLWARQYLSHRARLLRTTHQAISESGPCARVE